MKAASMAASAAMADQVDGSQKWRNLENRNMKEWKAYERNETMAASIKRKPGTSKNSEKYQAAKKAGMARRNASKAYQSAKIISGVAATFIGI